MAEKNATSTSSKPYTVNYGAFSWTNFKFPGFSTGFSNFDDSFWIFLGFSSGLPRVFPLRVFSVFSRLFRRVNAELWVQSVEAARVR
jgi:hypothetical protein